MNDPMLQRDLGPYRLQRVVGRGGMGTVYAALNLQTGESAAVKLLSPALASDASFRERFGAEIESLKKLRHPNIVQLYGYGEQDGQLYYSMELIEGSSLQEELRRRRRFSWREVTQIGIEICAALKHAHDHGIVHRDLKPANLFYTKDDQVKLLDFGIAKLFGNTGVTTGSVMGTADYMAPEQAEGKAVGPRSDLYSLGSVMYALLAGRPPFVGKSVPEVVHKVRYEPPISVSRVAIDVPVELDHLIDQLLEKNPQKRIPTALATAHRLKAMVHALSVRREGQDVTLNSLSQDHADVLDHASPVNPNDQETIRLEQGDHQIDNHLAVSTHDAESDRSLDHFTVVEPRREEAPGDRFPWQALPLALLFALLVWAGFQAVQWASRPATADSLYQQISTAANSTDPEQLAGVEKQIVVFLAAYPHDARFDEVQQWHERIELARLQRRLADRARRQREPSASALEALYLEIIPLMPSQPETALERLEALVELYQHADANDPQRLYVKLARQQLDRLRREVQQQAATQTPMIRQQLSAAQQLAATDPPGAQQIYEAIVTLYGNKKWALPLVDEARAGLQQLSVKP